jgi:glyoxylase-like metal-dependent hydrolase (beta-lactamase superfamily II)/rhodanese-related sulfurtransferase
MYRTFGNRPAGRRLVAIRVEELNDTNCKTYLLTSGTHAALVDPVRERLEHYLRLLRERSLALERVLETHTHADHLMIGGDAKRALGAIVVMHRTSPSPLVDAHVDEGDEIALGADVIGVLHTPGHTPDSVSYLCGGAVLTGDVLLIGGSGRTDFAGGDAGTAFDSVTGKLFTLPDDTLVWPAHDYHGRTSSTIGAERRGNPRFAGRTREDYVRLMAGLGLTLPERIQQVLQVNQSGFESEEVGGFPLVTDAAAVAGISVGAAAAALGGVAPPLVIDVREPEEFVGPLGHIPGALLVPMDALVRRLPKLAGFSDRDIVVVCRAGARSRTACAILGAAGLARVRNIEGGMLAWADAGLPVQR